MLAWPSATPELGVHVLRVRRQQMAQRVPLHAWGERVGEGGGHYYYEECGLALEKGGFF